MAAVHSNIFAGRDALAAYQQQDAEFYNRELVNPLLDLRSIGLGMGQGNQFDAAASGIATATRQADSAAGMFERDRMRTGLAVDPATSESRNRRLGLRRIISQVDAANRGAQGARDMTKQAQLVGTQLYGNAITNANASLSQIAGAETDRDAQYRQAQAADKAGDMQTLATIATIAAMFI
jgi:hypothetical protein